MALFNIDMLRFILVGVGSNVINYALYLFVYWVGAPLFAASVTGYVAGLVSSYHFGRTWVFGHNFAVSKSNVIMFMVVYAIGGIGMTLIIEVLVRTSVLNHQLSWFAGAIFAVINNYLGLKKLVFNKGMSN